jgi:GNAT superfamily N-acetyltransferase
MSDTASTDPAAPTASAETAETAGCADPTLRSVPWDHPDAADLRSRQRAEIEALYPPDSEPGIRPTAADIAVFLVAYAGELPVGCGALRQLGPGAAEIKRMYVVPEWRGRGVSVLVLAGLEDHAREQGWGVLRLETGPKQPAAARFYERSGYVRIPNFGPYAAAPASLCYERLL